MQQKCVTGVGERPRQTEMPSEGKRETEIRGEAEAETERGREREQRQGETQRDVYKMNDIWGLLNAPFRG